MSIDDARTGLGSAAPRSVTPYSVSIPHTFGMATASAYLRPGPTLFHDEVGTIRRVRAFQDPNRINLRKAGRAAIVLPLVLAVGVAVDNDAAALFASFGALAALVFSDFGGPLPRRFRAYVALAVIGGLLV